MSTTRIGLVLATGLSGATLATPIVGSLVDRLARRKMSVGLAVLAFVGDSGPALLPSFAGCIA